ncbi:MAG TPA: hypothetical protein VFH78_07425 [Candidatus Thermoplasmatota archaeon]|nr:hypothetical protein [Candidatus Thermoplasmatota archaeon]
MRSHPAEATTKEKTQARTKTMTASTPNATARRRVLAVCGASRCQL